LNAGNTPSVDPGRRLLCRPNSSRILSAEKASESGVIKAIAAGRLFFNRKSTLRLAPFDSGHPQAAGLGSRQSNCPSLGPGTARQPFIGFWTAMPHDCRSRISDQDGGVAIADGFQHCSCWSHCHDYAFRPIFNDGRPASAARRATELSTGEIKAYGQPVRAVGYLPIGLLAYELHVRTFSLEKRVYNWR
jgi:hypothetical protein